MKKIFFVPFLLLISFYSYSTMLPETKTLSDTVDAVKTRQGVLTDTVKLMNSKQTTIADSLSKLSKKVDYKPSLLDPNECNFLAYLLVLMPLILFAGSLFWLGRRMTIEDFKVSDVFKENEAMKVTQPSSTPATTSTNNAGVVTNTSTPTTVTTTGERPQSSSRLIAFISGLVAIILAVSTLSYCFFVYLKTQTFPDFGKLYEIVFSLGIGVVPYAFNRLGNGIKVDKP